MSRALGTVLLSACTLVVSGTSLSSSPSPSPSPDSVRILPQCVGSRDQFDAGHGGCDVYAENHPSSRIDFCESDASDLQEKLAWQVCSECGECADPTTTITTTTTATTATLCANQLGQECYGPDYEIVVCCVEGLVCTEGALGLYYCTSHLPISTRTLTIGSSETWTTISSTISTTLSTVSSVTSGTDTTATVCAGHGQQCLGRGWDFAYCCLAGLTCLAQNESVSLCLEPASSSTSTSTASQTMTTMSMSIGSTITEAPTPSTTAANACVNTAGNATFPSPDVQRPGRIRLLSTLPQVGCEWWDENIEEQGATGCLEESRTADDSDFTARDMCCACGGGRTVTVTTATLSSTVIFTSTTTLSSTTASNACVNTAGNASFPNPDLPPGRGQVGCEWWEQNAGWCLDFGPIFDDSDFTTQVMCCACGGGSTATHAPPTPSPPYETACVNSADNATFWDQVGPVTGVLTGGMTTGLRLLSSRGQVGCEYWDSDSLESCLELSTIFDDSDFTARDMCCACGGGQTVTVTTATLSSTVSISPTVSTTTTATASATISVSPTPSPPVENACVDSADNATFFLRILDGPQEESLGRRLQGIDQSAPQGCGWWEQNMEGCVEWSRVFDDSDFTALDMCCACGGGQTVTVTTGTMSSTTLSATTATSVALETVTISMTVTGLDYTLLMSVGRLVSDFVAVCQSVVSVEGSVDSRNVVVEVSAGSVFVRGIISVPSASLAEAVMDALLTSATLGGDLASAISAINGISVARDGNAISVSNILVTSSVAALTTIMDSASSTTEVLDTLEQIEEVEATAVQQLLASSETTVYVAASKDSAAVASVAVLFSRGTVAENESLMVSLPGAAGTTVSLPESVLDHIGTDQVIVVVTTVVVETIGELDMTSGAEVQRAVSVNIFNATSGAVLDLMGLLEPIVILFPNGTSEMECAFFDEQTDMWSTAGMGTELQTDGWLMCTTTHLTIFGAIIRGFAQTFTCSQAYLLSAESYQEVWAGDWTGQAGGIVLFAGIATFALLLAVAAALDSRERAQLSWRAEHFLIEPEPQPNARPPAAPSSASAVSVTIDAPSEQAAAEEAAKAEGCADPLRVAVAAAKAVNGLQSAASPKASPSASGSGAEQRPGTSLGDQAACQNGEPCRPSEPRAATPDASTAARGSVLGTPASQAFPPKSRSRGSLQQPQPRHAASVGEEDRLDRSQGTAATTSAVSTAPESKSASSLPWLTRLRGSGSADSVGSQSYYTVGKSALSEAASEAVLFGRSEMIAVIFGNLLAYFDEVYNVVMTLWEHLEESWEEGGTKSLEKAALGLLASSTARQASASLFMHPHDAQFLLQAAEVPCAAKDKPASSDYDQSASSGQGEDQRAGKEQVGAGDEVSVKSESKKDPERPPSRSVGIMSGSSLNRRRCCCCHLRRRRQRTWSTDSKTLLDLAGSSLDTPVPEHIEELRSQLAAKQEKQTDCHARWRSLPRIVVRSLVLHGPIGASFSQSILMSRSMRVLFLVSELLGAFMIETLLFEASGDTLRKTAPKECSSECDEMGGDHCFWEQVGYYIAVGVISALVAGIPVALMSALHHRDLKRVKNQKHKEFQLKLWRIQDSILWMIGVCYCAFAINYLTLFFASVSADNHGDWFVGAATILLMDFAVVPFLVSLSVPLLALSILSVLSCTHQMPKRTVMEERLAAKLSFGGVKSADGTETNEEQPVPHEHAAAASTSSSGAVGAEQPTQGSDNAARERSTMETKQVPVQAPPEQPTAEPVHVDVRQAAPEEPTAEPLQVPVRQAEPASKSGPNCAQAPAVSDGPASVVKPTGLSL